VLAPGSNEPVKSPVYVPPQRRSVLSSGAKEPEKSPVYVPSRRRGARERRAPERYGYT